MELPAIGRVDDPTTLDLDPIVIPLIGYTVERDEIEEKFSFRPVQPAGAALAVLRQTLPNGNVPIPPVMHFLDKCIIDENERARWTEFLDRDDVFIEQTALVQIYQALSEVYANRPTSPTSDSGGGGSTTGRTSRGGAAAKASSSRKKRST